MSSDFPPIPAFSIENFMKSITYPPEGMATGLARALVTEQGKDLASPFREAEILRRALELVPIGIDDDDLIAGNYGARYGDAGYLQRSASAQEQDYARSEEYLVHSEDERLASSRYMLFGIYTPAHTCVDYEAILRNGLGAFAAQAREATHKASDSYGRATLQAMAVTYEAVLAYATRYAALARKQAAGEGCSESRRIRLRRMAEALERVPDKSAADFFEALQSMWIIHSVIPASERSWASISLGRMDQFLLPYYRKWLRDGHSREEAKALLCAFFRLLDSYGDGSCALNLGGDYNELSHLFIEIEETMQLRSPIIAARIGKATAPEMIERFVNKTLFNIGQPTFYNEDNCARALAHRGVPNPEEFAVNSCMGNIIVGEELADMWGCCVNMNLPLELAVNGGEPLHGRLPSELRRHVDFLPSPPTSMDGIRESYVKYLAGVTAYAAEVNLRHAAWIVANRPNPLLSLLTKGCIENARDRAQAAATALGPNVAQYVTNEADKAFPVAELHKGSGAAYHNVTVLAMGFSHAADAFSAIETMVFERKACSLGDLIAAARSNYGGSKENLRLYAALLRCPKYATGDNRADANAAFVLNALADTCESLRKGSIRYLPTCHTIDANAQFGQCVYASLDGRRDGEPFGKNAGAVMSALKNTPVDLVHGAVKLPQERFSGGVPIDVYVPASMLDSAENRKKFADLLRVYFAQGGMQVQVNSVNVELLKKAYEKPEEYPHVIVRKGGFSLYFTDMFREVQADMIARFERESAV